jgi:hypothetical protein
MMSDLNEMGGEVLSIPNHYTQKFNLPEHFWCVCPSNTSHQVLASGYGYGTHDTIG